MTVTTFADLDIGIMAGRGDVTLTLAGIKLLTFKILQKFLIVEFSVPAIHLGDFCLQLSQITLRETSHHKEFLYPALCLCLCELKDGVDTLLLRIVDESAGIHDDNFTLRVIAIVRTPIAVGLHQAHQHLTVYEVLRTSE